VSATIWQDLRDAVVEQAAYRELLWQMTKRDLLLRYKQTVMGVAWAVFMPLTNTAVFSVIFTRVAPLPLEVPYPLFAYVGLVAWNYSASSLRFALISLSSNPQLVTKVYFPREVFPFSAVLVSLFDCAVSAVLVLPMLLWYGVPLTPSLLFLPVILAVQTVLTAACALLLAMGHLFYRDVKYLFDVAIVVAMFATAVLYPVGGLEGTLGTWLRANPMTVIIEAYRAAALFGRVPDLSALGLTAAGSLVFLLLAWLVFHRSEFRFAERA